MYFPPKSVIIFPFSPHRQVRYQNEGNGTGNILQHIVWQSKLFVWIKDLFLLENRQKTLFFHIFVNFKVIWLLDRLPEPALLALKNLSET